MFEFAVDSDFNMGDEYEEYCKEFHRFLKKCDEAKENGEETVLAGVDKGRKKRFSLPLLEYSVVLFEMILDAPEFYDV